MAEKELNEHTKEVLEKLGIIVERAKPTGLEAAAGGVGVVEEEKAVAEAGREARAETAVTTTASAEERVEEEPGRGREEGEKAEEPPTRRHEGKEARRWSAGVETRVPRVAAESGRGEVIRTVRVPRRQRSLAEFGIGLPGAAVQGAGGRAQARRRSMAAKELAERVSPRPAEEAGAIEELAEKFAGAPFEKFRAPVIETPAGPLARLIAIKVELPTDALLTVKKEGATERYERLPFSEKEYEVLRRILSVYAGVPEERVRSVEVLARALRTVLEKGKEELGARERRLVEDLLSALTAKSKISGLRTGVYQYILYGRAFKIPSLDDWMMGDPDKALKIAATIYEMIYKVLTSPEVIRTIARRFALVDNRLHEFLSNPSVEKHYIDLARQYVTGHLHRKTVYVTPIYLPLETAVRALKMAHDEVTAEIKRFYEKLREVEAERRAAKKKKEILRRIQALEGMRKEIEKVLEQITGQKKAEKEKKRIPAPA